MNGQRQHPKDYPDNKPICLCEGYNKKQLTDLIKAGDDTPSQLKSKYGIGGNCRYCRIDVALMCEYMKEEKEQSTKEESNGTNDTSD